MKFLRALAISGSGTFLPFIGALNPFMNAENTLVCPKLKELVLQTDGEKELNVRSVMRMREARASRGAKLG